MCGKSLLLRICLTSHTFSRIKFEESQLKGTQDRLAKLRSSVEREIRNISETLQTEISDLRQEIADSETEIASHRERLDELRADLEEKAAVSDTTRKTLSKAIKVLDDLQKEVGEWVRQALP